MKMDYKTLTPLVERIKNNDMDAFKEFYDSTKRIIYFNIYGFLANKEDCEDILQETYVNFLSHISSFNTKKPVIAYLITTSKNLSLNHLKIKKRQRGLTIEEESSLKSHDKYGLEEDELIKKMKQLLKPHEFEIIYLKVVEEYSHQEIATMLHKPLGTITWAYNNAIKKLQKGLGESYGKN